MLIRYVWPKRFRDESVDPQPTTYFWVECTPDEALEVLAAHKFELDDFRDYLNRIEGVRAHNSRDDRTTDFFGDDEFLDSFYSVVSFLVSSNGRRIEAAPITYPIGNGWNGYNPFREVSPRHFRDLSQLFLVVGDIFNESPHLADNIDVDDIRPRVNLAESGARGPLELLGHLPRTEQDGLNASDDGLAMAIFALQDSQGVGADRKRFADLSPDLTIELGRQFAARGSFDWRAGRSEYPFKYRFFRASETPLIEIYSRRLRAEKNFGEMQAFMNKWAGADLDPKVGLWASRFGDDELCEMFLYLWVVEMDGPVKVFMMLCQARLAGTEAEFIDHMRTLLGHYDGEIWPGELWSGGAAPQLAGPEDDDEFDDDGLPPMLGEPEPLPAELQEHFDLQHPVASNPFLGQKWVSLARTIEAVIERVRDEDDHCQFQTYGNAFGLSPNTSPFMQAKWNGPILRVEISANLVVRPELSEKQILELEFMGWSVPGEGNPNFERVWDVPALEDVSDFVLTSLVSIYGIEERDFFAFGLVDTPDFVGGLGYLDRLAASDSNRWRAIFCLQGMHDELL